MIAITADLVNNGKTYSNVTINLSGDGLVNNTGLTRGITLVGEVGLLVKGKVDFTFMHAGASYQGSGFTVGGTLNMSAFTCKLL